MHNTYIYIFLMAAVTYLIRLLPLTFVRRKITNKTIRSFLYYVPYVTLTVMTVPAIIYATETIWSGIAALIAGIIFAYIGAGLFGVAFCSCLVVFLIELVF